MGRRLGLVLVLTLAFLVAGVPLFGTSSSESGHVRPLSRVETGTLSEEPGSLPLDMGEVWATAAEENSSPDLATNGKTGTSGGRIALTFDDGPDPHSTPRILAVLRKQHVKATFFVVGRQVEKHPDILRQIVDEGHAIGNHSYDHADMSRLTPGQMRLEVQRTQEVVDKAMGYHYRMALMRPPYGNPYVAGSDALPTFRRVVREEQLFPVNWTIDSQDYVMDGDPQGVVDNVTSQNGAGRKQNRDEVVLMHDIHPQDAKALPGIIDHFERQGRTFVGVNELLANKYL
jgi:peptidoglycan/xylan/chitin deacetylase (PgdA/CDA1 family)